MVKGCGLPKSPVMLPLIDWHHLYNFSIRQSEFVVVNITTSIITDNYHQKGIEKCCFSLLCLVVINFVRSLCFLEYVFLVILNFQVLNDLMNSSSRQLVYLIILSFSMHCFKSQLRGRETVRYFTSVAARISELATTKNKSS